MSKFLSIIGFVTSFALFYVHQQTEIFRFAYLGQRRQVYCQDLLDKNNLLRYNIKKNGSLVSIGDKISGSSDFQMPESYRLVRIAALDNSRRKPVSVKNNETLLAKIFGIKRQAEAKTFNP